jgi:alkylhydroperoxidase family enzyme
MLEAWVGIAWPLRQEPSATRALRELAIMRTALLAGAEYEWAHHWDMAVQAGVDERKLRALADWRRGDAFTDEERAVLASWSVASRRPR